MWIQQKVNECDMTQTKFDEYVDGAGAVARGATGRWCVVLWAGPEFIKENNLDVWTPEQAEQWIEENHPNDWCDF